MERMQRRGTRIRLAAALLLLVAGTLRGQTIYFVESDPTPTVMSLSGPGTPVPYYGMPAAFTQIDDIAVDGQGRLFVALSNTSGNLAALHRYDPDGTQVALTPNLGIPIWGLHVDAAGRVYFVNQYTDVFRINPDGSDPRTLLATSSPGLGSVATDPLGTVYFTDVIISWPPFGSANIRLLETLGVTQSRWVATSPTGGSVSGLHTDHCGKLYFETTNASTSGIYRLAPGGPQLVHQVAAPEFFNRDHASDGAGTLFAVLSHPPGSGGPPDRLVAISGATVITLYQTTATGSLFGVTAWPSACATPTAFTGAVGASLGPPQDVLTVSGTAGGALREVVVPPLTAFSIDVAPPAGSASAAFTLFGRIGRPSPDQGLVGPPGVGSLTFTPCPFDLGNPSLFTLLDGLGTGGCAAFLPQSPAPWSLSVPTGFPMDFEFTLQGVILDPSVAGFGLACTNALVLRITSSP